MIIAYGPTEARLPAVCLLFHYWPETYPTVFHGNQTLQPVHYIWERKLYRFFTVLLCLNPFPYLFYSKQLSSA